MSIPEASFAYVGAFIDELTRAGVCHAVVSPGSRSTPMALLMSEHEDMCVWLHVDERSAGFFALGMAKAEQKPVALLCTSGTAAANYLPAVVEAYYARVPLLVLTADRPHELRDVGAPQTIQQIDLYGQHVKWFMEMALPENSPAMLRYVRTTASRAVATALSGPQGPVHLNFPFREPLVPHIPDPPVWAGGREADRGYVQVVSGQPHLSLDKVEKLAMDLQRLPKGLIICGPQSDSALAQAITDLAEVLQYPVLADPLSQLRTGTHDKTWVSDAYDAFLRDKEVVRTFEPEVIIRFGAMPVSKPLLLYLQKHASCRQIIVDADRGWQEPTLLATDMIHADPVCVCQDLVQLFSARQDAVASHPMLNQEESPAQGALTLSSKDRRSAWGQAWRELNLTTQETVALENENLEGLFEGRVFIELAEWLPEKTTLFVGNSMPVRDMDTFFRSNQRCIRVLANRGVNGIDGVVSSALGVSAVSADPLVLVLGDLSFYHDLNGLLAAKLQEVNVTIIVINNDGGGIFSFLPQAQQGAHFEELFGTPIGLDYRGVVEMYGGSFSRIDSWEAFCYEVQEGIATQGLTVVEVPTDRQDNVHWHRSLFQAVSTALQPVLQKVK